MRKRPWLVVVGLALVASGVAVGTRPVPVRSSQSEYAPTYQGPSGPEVTIITTQDGSTRVLSADVTDCGSTFVPRRCEPKGRLVWLTGLLLLPGVAALAAGVAQALSGRRDERDRWSVTDSLLLVGAPVLVIGTIVAVLSYNIFMYRWFVSDP